MNTKRKLLTVLIQGAYFSHNFSVFIRSGTNHESIDESVAPVHQKKDKRRMSLAVPKIAFQSPSPAPSPCHNENGDFNAGEIVTRVPTKKKSSSKVPLIVGKLNDEAKKIFRFRNKNSKNKLKDDDKNYNPPTLPMQMETLRVPTTNLLRKTSTSGIPPKLQRIVGKNNKPYYVLQDETLNNVLYHNNQRFRPNSPFLVQEAKPSSLGNEKWNGQMDANAKQMDKHAKGFLNEQLGKLETIEIPIGQKVGNHNQLMASNANPSFGTRPGWMSPAPYSGKTGGRRVSLTMNQFSYNLK